MSPSCLFTLLYSEVLLLPMGRAGESHAVKEVLCRCFHCLGKL